MLPGSGLGDRGKQLPRGFAPHHLGPPPVRPQMGKPMQSGPYPGPGGQFPVQNAGMGRPTAPVHSLPMQSPLYRSAGVLPPHTPVGGMRIPPTGNSQGIAPTGKVHTSSRMTVPVESYEHDPSAMYEGTSPHYSDNFKSQSAQMGGQMQYSGTPHPIPQNDNSESPRGGRGFPTQPNFGGDQLRSHPNSKGRERSVMERERAMPDALESNFRAQNDFSQPHTEIAVPLDPFQDSDRIRIRTEADRIAERLLKTEADLERLRKQGDLIGESLRKQKLHDVTSSLIASSSVSSPQLLTEDSQTRSYAPPPARPRSPVTKQVKAAAEDHMLAYQGVSAGTTVGTARERSTFHEVERNTPTSPGALPNSPVATSPTKDDLRLRTYYAGQEMSSLTSPPRGDQISFQMMQPSAVPLQTLSQGALSPGPTRPSDSSKFLADDNKSGHPSISADLNLKPTAPNSELAQKQLSAEDCVKLGLPPGTMWFDPTSKAQIKLITDQLKASKAEAASKSGTSNSDTLQSEKGRAYPTGPISTKSYTEEEIRSSFEALYLPGQAATLSQIFGAYKRLAPRAYASGEQAGGFDELAKLTECYKCCEAFATNASQGKVGNLTTIGEDEEENLLSPGPRMTNDRSGAQPSSPPVDCIQMYRNIFTANVKKGELHVQLGVSLEDLVQGHTANFTYDRMVVMEDGSVQPEKCQLQIDVVPGMRPGIEFTFENEGDDAPGHFPGDVRVTLCAEPHVRFWWAGNDLATQITVSLASALLGGVVGEVKSITQQVISLSVPKGTVVHPGAVFRVRGEGLPLSQDARLRGDLLVRMMVDFPASLDLSAEDKDTVRRHFSALSPGVNAAHHAPGAEVPKVQQEAEAAAEQDFGKGYPIAHHMSCAQQ